MVYQAFFLLCIVGVTIVVLTFQCRFRALAFGTIIVLASYLFELHGVSRGDWAYDDIDSLLLISGIPIEILFGYFTAGVFIVVLVENVPDISTEERRERALLFVLMAVGVIILFHSYVYGSISLAVGWAFLGIFGLLISTDRSVTLVVGICAFFADWIVEGMLTRGIQYYETHWDPTFGLVFMFAGMFITGVWQNRESMLEYLRPQDQDEPGA